MSASGQFLKESSISGSIESNSQYYFPDNALNYTMPESPFATNNYLKLNYFWKSLEAGIQYENYLPPLAGYSESLEGHRLSQRFITYRSEKFSVTAGTFFEQYGNGLILRAFEDRSLGINTSLDGVNLNWKVIDCLSIKSFAAKQLGAKNNGDAVIAGANLSFDLAMLLFPEKNIIFQTGASFIFKNHAPDDSITGKIYPEEVSALSGEIYFSAGDFGLQAEMVTKSFDPSHYNGIANENGYAILLNPSYSKKGFGFNGLIRRLKHMDFRSEPSTDQFFMLNFLPANSRQHKYSLANLYPYSVQPFNEYSHQLDFWILLPPNTSLGGQFGTKLSVNYSAQYSEIAYFSNTTSHELFEIPGLQYRDFNIELEKKWSKKLKSIVSYINLDMENYFLVPDDEPQKTQIAVADILYKFSDNHSLSGEIQHLWAETPDKNWFAWNAEYAFLQKWSVFISDMWNYGSDRLHYPNGGIQFRHKSAALSMNYGRNREGFKCSGGICRWIPAYSGLGFSVSISF